MRVTIMVSTSARRFGSDHLSQLMGHGRRDVMRPSAANDRTANSVQFRSTASFNILLHRAFHLRRQSLDGGQCAFDVDLGALRRGNRSDLANGRPKPFVPRGIIHKPALVTSRGGVIQRKRSEEHQLAPQDSLLVIEKLVGKAVISQFFRRGSSFGLAIEETTRRAN